MLNYLINHAKDYIWCSPEQDRQYIIKPTRLSPRLGSFGYQKVLWDELALPTKQEYYHVFQIGNVSLSLLGIKGLVDDWTLVSHLINISTLSVEIYYADGKLLLRGNVYMRYNGNNNLLMAIKDTARYDRLKDEAIYVRLYSNAYFDRASVDIGIEGTYVESVVVDDIVKVGYLQQKLTNYKNKEGVVFAYKNGYLVNDIIPGDTSLGDYVEFVYDCSVYRIIDFKVDDLSVFESIMDKKSKYMLSHDEDVTTIDFLDDIDIYLLHKEGNKYKGVYYHRNVKESIRMLTHRDYSVPVETIQAYQQSHTDILPSFKDIYIRLYIRRGGYDRPLIKEHHRIFELYKLPFELRKRAMLSIDSNVEIWQAPHLENSPYCKLMSNRNIDLDPKTIQLAYGYNAISKLIGDTPQATRAMPLADQTMGVPKQIVTLPIGLQTESTVYEYDSNGYLLGYHIHQVGTDYICNDSRTRLVEVISGIASIELDTVYNQKEVVIDPRYNHRVYLATLVGNEVLPNWVDITDSEIVTRENNIIKIDSYQESDYPLVLSDKYFLAYTLDVVPQRGIIEFSIRVNETHFNETLSRVSTIPPRRLDLWVDGKSLIENLDFYVSWPKVVIVNKQYIDHSKESQKITIRATGFCREDMSMETQREYGFVEHGYLSADRQHDIMDDKVLSFIVNGSLRSRETLDFAEDSTGVIANRVANGSPYSIRETVVTMKGQMYLDTYKLRSISLHIDKQVSDYLSKFKPEPIIDQISPIADKYTLYSPYLARIYSDLVSGVFDNERLNRRYSVHDILEWLIPYEDLLSFDPLMEDVDTRYIRVHPHPYVTSKGVTIRQFNFLKKVSDLLFKNTIDINQFFYVIKLSLQE